MTTFQGNVNTLTDHPDLTDEFVGTNVEQVSFTSEFRTQVASCLDLESKGMSEDTSYLQDQSTEAEGLSDRVNPPHPLTIAEPLPRGMRVGPFGELEEKISYPTTLISGIMNYDFF